MQETEEKGFFEVFKPIHFVWIALGVILDLVTKYWIVREFQAGSYKEILGDFFRLTLTFNTGFVFGLFQNHPYISLFATLFAILFLFYYRYRTPDMGHIIGWVFVMSGAFGNLIDKFLIKIPGQGFRFGFAKQGANEYTGVVDFLDFDWPDWFIFERWPAFNAADSFVLIGVFILIISMVFDDSQE